MISHITQAFRTTFARLPAQVQQQAREAYKLFRQNPSHPSLRWKHVHPTKPIYSVRVGRGYRAVGIRSADEWVLGTDLPLRPYDLWHLGAWEALWEDRHDRGGPGTRSYPCAARGTSVYPNALACFAIVVTLRSRYCAS